MITEITKAQFLALQVGRLKDAGRVHPSHISMLKMNNVWMARETARMAREILGANGIVDDYCVMRHMNNLESVYHLRRHARHSQTDHRRTHHRNRGVFVRARAEFAALRYDRGGDLRCGSGVAWNHVCVPLSAADVRLNRKSARLLRLCAWTLRSTRNKFGRR